MHVPPHFCVHHGSFSPLPLNILVPNVYFILHVRYAHAGACATRPRMCCGCAVDFRPTDCITHPHRRTFYLCLVTMELQKVHSAYVSNVFFLHVLHAHAGARSTSPSSPAWGPEQWQCRSSPTSRAPRGGTCGRACSRRWGCLAPCPSCTAAS